MRYTRITALCDRLRNFAYSIVLADCVWLAAPQQTESQRVGNQIGSV